MRKTTMLLLSAAMLVSVMAVPAYAGGNGNVQVDGLGYFPDPGVCVDEEGADADAAFVVEGDLVGCVYQYWGPGEWRPSNVYYEAGTELFVGCLGDGVTCGTFETTYVFTGKFSAQDFSGQLWGRCQHPIVAGTGTDDLEGITGRLDFKDNVDDGTFTMRGHYKLP